MTDAHYPRRSPQQWHALIERQAASGLSQAAFCARERAAVSSFQYWKRRLPQAPTREPGVAAESVADDGAALFAPLIAEASRGAAEAPASAGGWELELDLGDGVCLRFRRGTP